MLHSLAEHVVVYSPDVSPLQGITVLLCCARHRGGAVVEAEIVSVDMSGQAVFEAGVLLWKMAFRRHPVHDSYPMILESRAFDGADMCVLDDRERAEAIAAGYPVDEFACLVRAMVAMDASTRVSLAEARRRLEGTLNPTCVSDAALRLQSWRSGSPTGVLRLQIDLGAAAAASRSAAIDASTRAVRFMACRCHESPRITILLVNHLCECVVW
jgi:hypothetical protein